MSNRYILDPSGKIIKIDSFQKKIFDASFLLGRSLDRRRFDIITEDNTPKESTYYQKEGGNFDPNDTYLGNFRKNGTDSFGSSGLEVPFINEIDENRVVKTLVDEKPSFGFIGTDGDNTSVKTQHFRQYNSSNVLSNNDGKPLPFINEFEFYTGFTDPIGEDNNPGLESLNLLVNYLTSVVVEAAVIEGLIAVYKTTQNSSTIQGKNRLDTNKKFLVMGEYILDEVDVFSRYFFDVINYPIEEKSIERTYFLKRLACYFIGLNEWLSQDRLFSWERLLGQANVPFIGVDLNAILEKTADVTLSNLSNAASLKKMLLLVKKFNTQKYWVSEQLYKYKSKNYTDEIANIYNYYYFKFFIERVNVGIKIYNRIYAEDTIKKIVKKEHKTNRISQDFNDKNNNIDDTTEIDFNNGNEISDIKSSITDLALSGITGSDLNAEVDKIKENLSKAKNKNAKYNFTQKFKGLSINNIPSALMFNKTSFKNTNLSAKDENGKYVFKDVMQDFFAKTNENYLPIELVNKIEKNLEAEYMPFYFHDLRTNELLSFHAFIENIADSYSPEYTATSGFGRIDDVRSYVKTTRSISLSFTVVSMNKKDHNTMWYYLNKLVSMVYPQWSKGEELIIDKYTLEQPFSQVPTNSPLIRLRLGDLIKNNYSRFNLSRIFGLDNNKYIAREDIKSETEMELDWDAMGIDIAGIKNILKFNISNDNNIPYTTDDILVIRPYFYSIKNDIDTSILDDTFYAIALEVNFKSGEDDYYDNFVYHKTYTPELDYDVKQPTFIRVSDGIEISSLRYMKIITPNSPPSDDKYLEDTVGKYLFEANKIINNFKVLTKKNDKFLNNDHDINSIMKPFNDDGTINNPITQAYESRMSKGLAGHITSLDFNYSDSTWEIDDESKAPMMVKVTLNFAPIHDIPPGLDDKGMMRAANYNIGNLNNSMFK